MKKVIELLHLRLNEIIDTMKKWINGDRGNNDDRFNHPFAIF